LGDYLDAMVDRYREVLFYTGFAISGYSIEAFFALSGALIVSFAKARTAMCVVIDDHDWPAIGGMADRTILLTLGLTIASAKPAWCRQHTAISATLLIIGLVTYIGSIQRILYAKKIISKKIRDSFYANRDSVSKITFAG
jgi:phosphatidylglycerophosphate synthase